MYLARATGIDLTVAKLIIALAFAIYVIIGGYSAVVWTDTIQAPNSVLWLYINGYSCRCSRWRLECD